MKKAVCWCGSHKHFKDCCGPYLNGTAVPDTPEKLMRSRYSAFCTKNIEYLISSRHPSGKQMNELKMLADTMGRTQWLGLKIIKADTALIAQGTGSVEYTAFYEDNGIAQLHENAKFVYEEHQWYYKDGTLLPPIKISRNEPCWCGSGKKFKKCHG